MPDRLTHAQMMELAEEQVDRVIIVCIKQGITLPEMHEILCRQCWTLCIQENIKGKIKGET